MTIDISEPLRRAHSKRSLWAIERAREALAQGMAHDPTRTILWEEDHEYWAQLVDPDGVAALVRVDMPLVFLFREDEGYASWLEEWGVVVVRGRAFSQKEFSVAGEVLWEVFYEIEERDGFDDMIDPACFAMHGLVFITI